MAGEAAAPVVVQQSQPTQTPEPVKPTPAPTPEPGQPPKDWAQEYRRLEAEHSKKVREHIIERRKWEADKKTTGERLSKLSELEKRESQARLNPTEFAKGLWGDNWYEKLMEAKLNGVPPADLIASELGKMREEFEGKLAAREQSERQSAAQRQQQQLEQARASMRSEATEWLEAHAKDFPILERLGKPPAVAKRIADRIEHEFHRTTKRDDSGTVLRQGKVLSTQEAAELIEADMLAIAEGALGAEKYRAKLGEKLKPLSSPATPATVSTTQQQSDRQQQSANGQQQRKTLSNDIGAKTTGDAPPTTPAERRERALAAFEAERAKRRAT